jgi:methyltransferase (TIGR00027 family)
MIAEEPIVLTSVHQTALKSAALRAAHELISAEPWIFRDELALPLSDMTAQEVIAIAARVPDKSASSCILRSRYTEDRLAAARNRLNQYVVLGAGLDSYALRMGGALGDLTVFEVDDPTFLAWKRQRIAQLSLAMPAQLHFVPCDFETTSLAQALDASDFDPARPCFLSWLGVTQYLTPEATAATLRWAGQRPAGSEIVLTFLNADDYAEEMVASMLSNGIAALTHFTPDEMTALLRDAGFGQIEHLTPEVANERYFADRTDGLRAPGVQRLVSAIV